MIIRKAEFLTAAAQPQHFPKTPFPEIAFAGRSNVGKSSLINALVRRKSLVRTSRHPGQTRTLNFFLINGRFMLVDLPGYGFSRAPREVIRTYHEALSRYVQSRSQLVLIVLLLDIRRIPSSDDRTFFQRVRLSRRPYRIVLTKTDTVGQGQWRKSWSHIAEALETEDTEPLFFSSKSGRGREELWRVIENHLNSGFPEKEDT